MNAGQNEDLVTGIHFQSHSSIECDISIRLYLFCPYVTWRTELETETQGCSSMFPRGNVIWQLWQLSSNIYWMFSKPLMHMRILTQQYSQSTRSCLWRIVSKPRASDSVLQYRLSYSHTAEPGSFRKRENMTSVFIVAILLGFLHVY